MLGNGFYKPRSLETGTPVAKGVNRIAQFCFAMETRELAKLMLGSKEEPQEIGERQVLTSGDFSSLVIDNLGDQARGENATVACFYFDFAARSEQSRVSMLGSLLKQLVCGQEIPQEISQSYQDQKNVIGGRGPRLPEIVEMLQTTTSERRTFICIDALDECTAGHRVKVLDSLKRILQKSPGTRIFMTGRPHILPEIRRRLAGRITSISVSPKRDDIITYLHTRLAEDTAPDAMDTALEAEILRKIPESVSEMYVAATTLVELPYFAH